jgi:hypothetical protein
MYDRAGVDQPDFAWVDSPTDVSDMASLMAISRNVKGPGDHDLWQFSNKLINTMSDIYSTNQVIRTNRINQILDLFRPIDTLVYHMQQITSYMSTGSYFHQLSIPFETVAIRQFIRSVLHIDLDEAYIDKAVKLPMFSYYGPKICVLCERPSTVHLKDGKPHCETGNAIKWSDCGIYLLNGIVVPEWLISTPADRIMARDILAIYDVDVRREAIRKVGVTRMAAEGVIKDKLGQYRLIDMSKVFGSKYVLVGYAPYLLMKNPSVEDTWHMEGVDPACRTVQQALNWRAGNINIRWEPECLN